MMRFSRQKHQADRYKSPNQNINFER